MPKFMGNDFAKGVHKKRRNIHSIQCSILVLLLTTVVCIGYYYIYTQHVSQTKKVVIQKCSCAPEEKSEQQSKQNQQPTNYTVISASVPDFSNDTITIQDGKPDNTNRAWGYLFQLPLTCLAWRRLGIHCVTIITVDYSKITPEAEQLLRYVDRTLRKLSAIVVYFDVPSTLKVRLGQILRLFPASLLSSSKLFNDDDFLITGDSDLWPINLRGYDVPFEKSILIYFSDCCGKFKFNGTDYTMFPLSHFIMRVKLWKKLFSLHLGEENMKNDLILSNTNERLVLPYKILKDLMKNLEKYTQGENLYRAAKHNSNLWYLDQLFASVIVNEYITREDNTSHTFIKQLPCHRMSVIKWNFEFPKIRQFKCLGDAHVFKDQPWSDMRWNQLSMLTKLLFDNETLNFMQNYRNVFKLIYDGSKVNSHP